MNAINRFHIARQQYSLQDIKRYYDYSLRAIECTYSASANNRYDEIFFGRAETEIRQEAAAVKRELSHLCSLCAMAYIESLFRIDSFVRVKHKCKGDLTSTVRALLKAKSSIPLVRFEDLLDVWKDEYASEAELFRNIKNSFKFRHWIAHGRYWQPHDDIDRHFDFPDIFILAQQVEAALGHELRTQSAVGEPMRRL